MAQAQHPATDTEQARASMARAAEPVQVQVLAGYIGNDAALIEAFLGEFRSTARELGHTMAEAFVSDHLRALADAAHQLKSPARTVGATTLGALCERLESAGRAGDATTCAAIWTDTRAELEAVEAFLAARSAQPSRP